MTITKLKAKFISTFAFGLLFLILISHPILSQSNVRLTGQVRDAETGFPLAEVAVHVEKTADGTYTDADGFFRIENISPGTYSIQISLLGYETQNISNVEIGVDFPARVIANLKPVPLQSDTIVVMAEWHRDGSGLEGEKIMLSGADLDRFRQLGLPQLLQQVAGVQIESTGSGGGRSIVRIHGGRSSQVLVMLDGQRLNNPQTGEVDLSEIPLEQIESIEVIRQGNSALFGSSAFDGVIEFHTRRTPQVYNYTLHSQAGSFSSYMGSVSAGLTVLDIGGLFNYQQDYSRQNFDYKYEGKTFTRENAWYRNRKFFGKMKYETGRYSLNLLYNRREGDRALPCSFFNECGDVDAAMEETVQAWQSNHRLILSSHSYLEGLIAYHRLYQFYNNENDPVRITRYKTEQTNHNFETQLSGRFSAGHFADVRVGLNYLKETMNQDNLLNPPIGIGEKSRESKAGFAGAEVTLPLLPLVWRKASIRSSLRYEKHFSHPSRFYPTVGISFVPAIWKAINISGGWYKAVRYPDFNSLFWKGDSRARGNPELEPERKTAWNAAIRLRHDQWYFPELNLHYYSEKITDLIFWHRSFNGVWEPRNEDKAEKRGVDLELRQNMIPSHVQIQTAYSWIDAVNKVDEPNRYDKNIIFVPQHTINTSLWIGWGNWQTQVVYRAVSERETIPANSNGTQLNAYEIWDASCGYKHQIGKLTIDLGMAVKNITGSDYQLLYGYPMPGQEIQLNLALNFQTK